MSLLPHTPFRDTEVAKTKPAAPKGRCRPRWRNCRVTRTSTPAVLRLSELLRRQPCARDSTGTAAHLHSPQAGSRATSGPGDRLKHLPAVGYPHLVTVRPQKQQPKAPQKATPSSPSQLLLLQPPAFLQTAKTLSNPAQGARDRQSRAAASRRHEGFGCMAGGTGLPYAAAQRSRGRRQSLQTVPISSQSASLNEPPLLML